MNRVDALEAQRKYLLNGDRMAMAMIQDTPDGSKIEMSDSGLNESPDTHVDFLETDYKH